MGKKSRVRNRARDRAMQSRAAVSWTAAGAARAAIAHLRELKERYNGNPYTQMIAKARLADALTSLVQQLEMRGVAATEAHMFAQVEIGLEPSLEPIPVIAERASRQQIADEVDSLSDAEPYVVSPGMHAVVLAAAQTLTTADLVTLLTDEDIPHIHGFVYLPGNQVVAREPQTDLRAISWQVTTMPQLNGPRVASIKVNGWESADGTLQFSDFVAARRAAKRAGHPLPSLIPDSHRLYRIDPNHDLTESEVREVVAQHRELLRDAEATIPHAEPEVIGEYDGASVADDDGNFEMRYLFAFLRLCNQRIATIDRAGDLGETYAGSRREVDDVRVLQLRTYTTDAVTAEEARRTYNHRWVVRMHKVRQWYPTEGRHKIIWRGPYIKGPEDAPLLDVERVHALVR